MHFKIQHSELKKVEVLSNFINRNHSNRVLTLVYVEVGEGEVYFRVSDGKLDVTYILEAEVLDRSVASVCLERVLLSVISYYAEGEIEFKLVDDLVIVKQGSIENKLKYTSGNAYLDPMPYQASELFDPLNLLEGINLLSHCVSTKPDQRVYNTYELRPEGVIGTDTNKTGLFVTPLAFLEEKIYPLAVDIQKVGVLLKESSRLIRVGTDNKYLNFNTVDWSCSIRLIQRLEYDNYYDHIRSFIDPADNKMVGLVFNKERLKKILSLLLEYTKMDILDSFSLSLKKEGDKLGLVFSLLSAVGQGVYELELEQYKLYSEPFDVVVNINEIMNTLAKVESEDVTLSIFQSEQGSNIPDEVLLTQGNTLEDKETPFAFLTNAMHSASAFKF